MSVVEPSDAALPSDDEVQYLGNTNPLVEGEVLTERAAPTQPPVDEEERWIEEALAESLELPMHTDPPATEQTETQREAVQATQTEGADPTIVVETQRAPSPENAATEEAEKTASADALEKPQSESAAVGEKRSLPKEVRIELEKLRKKAAHIYRQKEKVALISKETVEAEKSANEALTKHNQHLQKRLDQLEASIGGEHSANSPHVTSEKTAVPAETP